MISKSLLNIFSFSILSMSSFVKLQYDKSSHCNPLRPNRIYVTTYVLISFATTLNLFNLTQFLQIAKNPYFVIPVAPIKSY